VSGDEAYRAAGALALAVGVAATASPRRMLAGFGIPGREVTGAAALGWRMFGIRTAVVGGGIVAGDASARAVLLPVQLADQAVFAHALATRSVPARAAVLAMATSGVLIALDAAGKRAPAAD